jgi:basic amino acid/polyamine antiporter, APA family
MGIHPAHVKRGRIRLKRELSLFEVTIAGIGIILGAGIYALIGIAAGHAGNLTWLAFLVSGIIAALTGMSYAELSTIFKKDAAEYDYVKAAFNKKLAFWIALAIILTGVISAATVALSFGSYLYSMIGSSIFWLAVAITLLSSYINHKGIKSSSFWNTIFTFVETGGLLIIIIMGIPYWTKTKLLHGISGASILTSFADSATILKAASLVFFAYMGFETMVKLTEETKNPEKTIPKALFLSVLISTILYILVAISAVSILNWKEIAASQAPLATVAAAVLGSPAFILLAVIALFSTANTVLMTLVTTSRLVYGMGCNASLPHAFCYVDDSNHTPTYAIIFTLLLTIGFIFIKNIELVAELTNVFLFLTFAFVNLSNIILRYKDKRKRAYKAHLNIGNFPVVSLLGFLSCVYMLIFILKHLLF